MSAVYKYPLNITDVCVLRMPEGAVALHVGEQNGRPMLWARVDPAKPLVEHHFRIAGTGHPLKWEDWYANRHIGSFEHHGTFIWHVFEASRYEG